MKRNFTNNFIIIIIIIIIRGIIDIMHLTLTFHFLILVSKSNIASK